MQLIYSNSVRGFLCKHIKSLNISHSHTSNGSHFLGTFLLTLTWFCGQHLVLCWRSDLSVGVSRRQCNRQEVDRWQQSLAVQYEVQRVETHLERTMCKDQQRIIVLKKENKSMFCILHVIWTINTHKLKERLQGLLAQSPTGWNTNSPKTNGIWCKTRTHIDHLFSILIDWWEVWSWSVSLSQTNDN